MIQGRALKVLSLCVIAFVLLTNSHVEAKLNTYLASMKGKSTLQPSLVETQTDASMEAEAEVKAIATNCQSTGGSRWGDFDFSSKPFTCDENKISNGFWRNGADTKESDGIFLLEELNCCDTGVDSAEEIQIDIRSGLNGWWSCDPGYILAGFARTGDIRTSGTNTLNQISKLVCRRPKGSPKKASPDCYELDISTTWGTRDSGWSTCDKPGYYVTAINRPDSNCGELSCWTQFRCCPITPADCSVNNGGCDGLVACTDTDSGHNCGACPEGYSGNGEVGCKDIDECSNNNGGCDSLAKCYNKPGSKTCGPCPSGYTGNGATGCKDVNECLSDNGGCDPLARCVNTRGSRICGECAAGYSGNGETGCRDINECVSNNGGCDTLSKCINLPGSRTCGTCPRGYSGDGLSKCRDIDECMEANGGCDPLTQCQNAPGSRLCGACPKGYRGDGEQGCKDIDECAVGNGGCDSRSNCYNRPGAYECGECPPGFTGNGYRGCEDVDECQMNNGDCDPLSQCRNIPGSRVCGNCPPGYRGDGLKCFDVNECADNNGGCDPITACRNTPGSRECGNCPRGWKGNGATGCTDIDECHLIPNGGCDPNVECKNTPGSRTCGPCPAGMIGNGFIKCFNDSAYIEDLMYQQKQRVAVESLEQSLKSEVQDMLDKYKKLSAPFEDIGLINPLTISGDQVNKMTNEIAQQIITEMANKYSLNTATPTSTATPPATSTTTTTTAPK